MLIETKFGVGDKAYYLGKDKYQVRICESEVSRVMVRSFGNGTTIEYNLYDEDGAFREETLFSSVKELLDEISKEENIICDDPKGVIWE